MNILAWIVVAMAAGMIGGMLGVGTMLIIFWPELKQPTQLDDEIPPAWRQHAGLENNDD